jgi:hypothetical protein
VGMGRVRGAKGWFLYMVGARRRLFLGRNLGFEVLAAGSLGEVCRAFSLLDCWAWLWMVAPEGLELEDSRRGKMKLGFFSRKRKLE